MMHIASAFLLALAALSLALTLAGVVPSALGVPPAVFLIGVYAYVLYSGARFKPPEPRQPTPIGERAVVVEKLAPTGLVKLGGVYWRVLCDGCEAEVGDEVLVVNYRDGLLVVKKCST